MNKINEQDIIARIQEPRTRRKAFEDIVNMFGQTLYWQIRRIVTYHEDADDVLQNTFIKAWSNLDKFRGDSKISTWLYRIAYNNNIYMSLISVITPNMTVMGYTLPTL